MHRHFVQAFVISLSLGFATDSYAANTPVEKDNLRGVTAVQLVVAPVPDWAEENKVTKPVLRALLEHELESARIKTTDVVPDDGGTLELVVTGIKFPEVHLYLYTCHLKFYQRVRLLYDKSISLAVTWSDESFGGSLDAHKSAIASEDSVKESVDKFVADYRAANPLH